MKWAGFVAESAHPVGGVDYPRTLQELRELTYYLDEFTFRFNRRDATSRGLLFYRLLQQAVQTGPNPLHDLLDPDMNPYLG